MQKQNNNKIQKVSKFLSTSRGFTLLFASLIGALVFAVGIAILNIALKQIQLSSAGRESQKAFYSADAGVECALFLDRGGTNYDCRLGFFGTPSTTSATIDVCGASKVDPDPYLSYEECFGKNVVINVDEDGTLSYPAYVISSFILSNDNTSGGSGGDNYDMCFNVAVKKVIDDPSTTDIDETSTTIESRGYNNCNESSTNRYERAIRVKNS